MRSSFLSAIAEGKTLAYGSTLSGLFLLLLHLHLHVLLLLLLNLVKRRMLLLLPLSSQLRAVRMEVSGQLQVGKCVRTNRSATIQDLGNTMKSTHRSAMKSWLEL